MASNMCLVAIYNILGGELIEVMSSSMCLMVSKIVLGGEIVGSGADQYLFGGELQYARW